MGLWSNWLRHPTHNWDDPDSNSGGPTNSKIGAAEMRINFDRMTTEQLAGWYISYRLDSIPTYSITPAKLSRIVRDFNARVFSNGGIERLKRFLDREYN